MDQRVEAARRQVADSASSRNASTDPAMLEALATEGGVAVARSAPRVTELGASLKSPPAKLNVSRTERLTHGQGEGHGTHDAQIDAERAFRIAEDCLRAEGIDARAHADDEEGWATFAVREPTGDALVTRSSAGRRAAGPAARLAAQILLRIGMRPWPDEFGARWQWLDTPPVLPRRYPRAPVHAPRGLGDYRLPATTDAAVARALRDTGAQVPAIGAGDGAALATLHAFAKRNDLAVETAFSAPAAGGDPRSCFVELRPLAAGGGVFTDEPDACAAVRLAIVDAHRRLAGWCAQAVLEAAGFTEVLTLPERHGFVVELASLPENPDPSLSVLASALCPVVEGRRAAEALVAAGFAEAFAWPGRWRPARRSVRGARQPGSGAPLSLRPPFERLRRLAATRPDRPNGPRLHVGASSPVQGFGGARVIFALDGDWRSGPDDWRPDPIAVVTPFCFSAGWLVHELLACIWSDEIAIDKYSLCAALALGALRYQRSVGDAETERGMLGAMLDAAERAVAGPPGHRRLRGR